MTRPPRARADSRALHLHDPPAPIGWPAAAEAFLAGRSLSAGTRRVYATVLRRVGARLPPDPLEDLSPAALETAVTAVYAGAAPATWNRVIATLGSFLDHADRQGWLPDGALLTARLDRRRPPADHTRALDRAALQRLWAREDVALREKTLWRLLYETAARTQEVLALNVEDLDLPNKRAKVIRRGGDTDWVFWQSGSAQLLPRLIGRRRRGPLFLATGRPAPAAPRRASTSIRTPAARGCPTAAPPSCSPRPPARRYTSCGTLRSPTSPRTASTSSP